MRLQRSPLPGLVPYRGKQPVLVGLPSVTFTVRDLQIRWVESQLWVLRPWVNVVNAGCIVFVWFRRVVDRLAANGAGLVGGAGSGK